MQNKNASLLKICHLILIFAGAALCIYGCTFDGASVIDEAALLLKIAALAASFVYLLKGYQKNADLCYKAFMWLLGIAEIIGYTSLLTKGIPMPFFRGFISVMTFVAFILIIGAKDYGKTKSSIISVALVVFCACSAVSEAAASMPAVLSLPAVIAICRFFFAATAALMVRAKYNDKDARGAK